MRDSRGFTLIEMLAVSAIIVVLTSVLLVKNSSFGGVIILRSLAYDVALSVREAQRYGISVRQSGSGVFSNAYGVEVRAASAANYLLYVDRNADGYYGGSGELVTQYSLKQGYRIADLCYTPASGGAEICGAQKIDVTFKRPEPDAFIRVNDQAAINQQARILLAAPNGTTVSIVVEATGQISVQ